MYSLKDTFYFFVHFYTNYDKTYSAKCETIVVLVSLKLQMIFWTWSLANTYTNSMFIYDKIGGIEWGSIMKLKIASGWKEKTLLSMSRFLCNHILRQSQGLYTNIMIKYSHTSKHCIIHQDTYSCKQSCGKRKCENYHRTRGIPHCERLLYEMFGPCCRQTYSRLAKYQIL